MLREFVSTCVNLITVFSINGHRPVGVVCCLLSVYAPCFCISMPSCTSTAISFHYACACLCTLWTGAVLCVKLWKNFEFIIRNVSYVLVPLTSACRGYTRVTYVYSSVYELGRVTFTCTVYM